MFPSYLSHFAWDTQMPRDVSGITSGQCKLYLLLFEFLSEENFNFATDFGLHVSILLIGMTFDV